MQGVNFVETRN